MHLFSLLSPVFGSVQSTVILCSAVYMQSVIHNVSCSSVNLFFVFFCGWVFSFCPPCCSVLLYRLVSYFSLHFLHFHFTDNELLVACQCTRGHPSPVIHYEEPFSGADLQNHPMKAVHIRITYCLVWCFVPLDLKTSS